MKKRQKNRSTKIKIVLSIGLGIFILCSYLALSGIILNDAQKKNDQQNNEITINFPNQKYSKLLNLYKVAQNFSGGLPENFSTDFVETLTDLAWDYDNDSGGGGILVIFWSYVPGFGSNGSVTTNVLFLLGFAGGTLYAVDKWG